MAVKDAPDIKTRLVISNIRSEESTYLYNGQTNLFGTDFHVRLIRVKDGDIIEPAAPGHFTMVWQIFSDILRLNDGALHPIRLPNMDGRYVMVIYPFAE